MAGRCGALGAGTAATAQGASSSRDRDMARAPEQPLSLLRLLACCGSPCQVCMALAIGVSTIKFVPPWPALRPIFILAHQSCMHVPSRQSHTEVSVYTTMVHASLYRVNRRLSVTMSSALSAAMMHGASLDVSGGRPSSLPSSDRRLELVELRVCLSNARVF